MKKKIRRYIILILFILIIFLLLDLCIFAGKKNKKYNNTIVGTWTTDGVTVYRFNKDNTGALIVPLGDYDFIYEIKKNSLFIDFKSEKSIDSKYNYYFEKDKLILEGSNGVFTFSRVEKKIK